MTITHEFKVKQSSKFSDWEKVKTKYADSEMEETLKCVAAEECDWSK